MGRMTLEELRDKLWERCEWQCAVCTRLTNRANKLYSCDPSCYHPRILIEPATLHNSTTTRTELYYQIGVMVAEIVRAK